MPSEVMGIEMTGIDVMRIDATSRDVEASLPSPPITAERPRAARADAHAASRPRADGSSPARHTSSGFVKLQTAGTRRAIARKNIMTQVSETNNKAKASGKTRRGGTSGGGETDGGGGSGPQPIPERPKKTARKRASSDKEPSRSSRA